MTGCHLLGNQWSGIMDIPCLHWKSSQAADDTQKTGNNSSKLSLLAKVTDNALTLHVPTSTPTLSWDHYSRCCSVTHILCRTIFLSWPPFHEKVWKKTSWNETIIHFRTKSLLFVHIILLKKNHVVIIARYIPTYWMFLHSASQQWSIARSCGPPCPDSWSLLNPSVTKSHDFQRLVSSSLTDLG